MGELDKNPAKGTRYRPSGSAYSLVYLSTHDKFDFNDEPRP